MTRRPAALGSAVDPLGMERTPLPPDHSGVLLTALRGAFSTTYLTLTSIIQGVALAYLVVIVDEEMGAFATAHWLLIATTFLIIAAAWHEYMTAVTVFVWIPRLRDSLIPFLLGGSELMLIRSLRRPAEIEWSFFALGTITVVTLLAFVNMYRSAAAEGELNGQLLSRTAVYRRVNLTFVAVAGILFFAFGALEVRVPDSAALDVALSAGCLALVLLFLVRGAFYWTQVIAIAEEESTRERVRRRN
jgi:hypothetical protein